MKNIFIGLIAVWGLFLVSCETREPMAEVIEKRAGGFQTASCLFSEGSGKSERKASTDL